MNGAYQIGGNNGAYNTISGPGTVNLLTGSLGYSLSLAVAGGAIVTVPKGQVARLAGCGNGIGYCNTYLKGCAHFLELLLLGVSI